MKTINIKVYSIDELSYKMIAYFFDPNSVILSFYGIIQDFNVIIEMYTIFYCYCYI